MANELAAVACAIWVNGILARAGIARASMSRATLQLVAGLVAGVLALLLDLAPRSLAAANSLRWSLALAGPTAEFLNAIVHAQEAAQPFAYPDGLIEVPMSPMSDIVAFRTGRWKLDWFLTMIRRGGNRLIAVSGSPLTRSCRRAVPIRLFMSVADAPLPTARFALPTNADRVNRVGFVQRRFANAKKEMASALVWKPASFTSNPGDTIDVLTENW